MVRGIFESFFKNFADNRLRQIFKNHLTRKSAYPVLPSKPYHRHFIQHQQGTPFKGSAAFDVAMK